MQQSVGLGSSHSSVVLKLYFGYILADPNLLALHILCLNELKVEACEDKQ
jgi:hypothetical protein